MNNKTLEDIGFLLALLPDWAKKTTPGLDPTFYGTGSYERDRAVVDRVNSIKLRMYDENDRNTTAERILGEEPPEEEETPTKTIIPQWFYKLVFVVCNKISKWAMKKAGIKPDQHKKAEEGTKRIKDASDKIPDTPVSIDDRDPDDIFNNS